MTQARVARTVIRTIVPRRVRNWIRSPQASAAWLWAEARYALGRVDTVEIRPGWRVRCHPAAVRFAYSSQISDPVQVVELDAFIACCQPGMALLDVGAHFGLFSFAALHYGGVTAKAVAVDPSPTAIRMMRIQAALNQSGDRLRLVRAAVGDTTGREAMVAAGVMSAGYYERPQEARPVNELSVVDAITVDGFVTAGHFRPTHMKVDVEGAEESVIKGARNLLSQTDGPVLFMELHNAMRRQLGETSQTLLGLLRDLGYSFYGQDGKHPADFDLVAPEVTRFIAAKPAHRSLIDILSAASKSQLGPMA